MKRKLLLLLILAFQGAVSAWAQTPQASPTPAPEPQRPEDIDVVRITTNLVQVDAVVTDNKGKIVTDLKPQEIQIFEDGRQQKLTHFTFITTAPPETASVPEVKPRGVDKNALPPPPTRLKQEDVRRTIAIVVDDLGLSFESTYFVRRALKKFVDEQMQPGDLVAIIRSSGGMGALQSFTADRRQLYASIERVKWYPAGRAGVAAFGPMEPPTPGAGGPDIDALKEEQEQFRQDVFSVGTLGALSYVVKGMRELPGRKSILLISDGFKIVERQSPDRTMGLQRPSSVDRTMQGLQVLIDQASRASVVIYTMNATGLQTLGLTAADDTSGRNFEEVNQQLDNRRLAAFDNQSGLDYLAHNTGGIAIRNNNDLAGGIKKIMADQKSYYLIGYRPDESTFDPRTGRRKFHHIALKVTRPGKYSVRMRNGFFGVSDEETSPVRKTPAQQLIGALTSPFGATGVHLQLTSLFANDAKAGSFMRSILHIDARDLTFTNEPDGFHKAVFDLLAITFGDNGASVDQPTGRTYTIKLPADLYKRTLRDGLVYTVTVPIKKPGAYQLRISLRDSSTDRVGSASQFVEVPDLKKNRVAVSGIVLRGENPRRSATSSGTASPGKAAPGASPAPAQDQEEIEQDPVASPAVRHFDRGMRMDYGFAIYNGHVDKATNLPQLTTQVLLFRDGKPVFTGNENPYKVTTQTDMKRLLAGGTIQLGTNLSPGEYMFEVVVTDLLADQKHRVVTQWMDFQIVK